jgi:AraC family transcriptional regulator
MEIQVVNLAPIHVAMIRHRGSYDDLPPLFDRLFEWVDANQVPVKRTIGIYWDNPDFKLSWLLNSAACVEVDPGYRLPDPGGLKIESSMIVGGTYATTRYIGPYEAMKPIWTAFTQQIEGPMGRVILGDPAFEVYVNDPADTPSSELITELYMPVR